MTALARPLLRPAVDAHADATGASQVNYRTLERVGRSAGLLRAAEAAPSLPVQTLSIRPASLTSHQPASIPSTGPS